MWPTFWTLVHQSEKVSNVICLYACSDSSLAATSIKAQSTTRATCKTNTAMPFRHPDARAWGVTMNFPIREQLPKHLKPVQIHPWHPWQPRAAADHRVSPPLTCRHASAPPQASSSPLDTGVKPSFRIAARQTATLGQMLLLSRKAATVNNRSAATRV